MDLKNNMNLMMHRIIMWFVFIIGTIFFSCYSFSQEFLVGTIILTISMLFINLYGFATRSLPSRFIFHLLSVSIVFVAVAVLGNYGVEQKPVGYNTLYQFNLEGIAASLILFLFASLLLIMGTSQKTAQTKIQTTIKKPSIISKTGPPKNIIKSDDWQEATVEDIRSGQYQIYKP